LFWTRVFFTVGTLIRCGSGFGSVDTFLEFFLKGLAKKLSSLNKKKRFEISERLTEGGLVGDQIALIEQGIQFRAEVATGV
jgi:hypothetical protein